MDLCGKLIKYKYKDWYGIIIGVKGDREIYVIDWIKSETRKEKFGLSYFPSKFVKFNAVEFI